MFPYVSSLWNLAYYRYLWTLPFSLNSIFWKLLSQYLFTKLFLILILQVHSNPFWRYTQAYSTTLSSMYFFFYFRITNNVAKNNIAHMYFHSIWCIFSEEIPINGIAAWRSKHIENVLRYWQIPLLKCCTHFSSHQQNIRMLVFQSITNRCFLMVLNFQ